MQKVQQKQVMHSELYDAVILGGAFSGAATGLLLKRRNSALRVLILEKAVEFDRKVGESTTEVSSCFMTRVLGITNHLGHEQLAKQGLRLWFSRNGTDGFDECVEIGAMYNSRLAGYQVDRATLDEHLLALAVAEGCELWRPAKVTSIELGAGRSVVEVMRDGETRTVGARWVVDASGRAAMLARKLGNLEPIEDQPTCALWGRFRGVGDWDGNSLRSRYPEWADAAKTARGWATNHLCGLGWWVWIIPLKGGDVSIGLVYDSRIFTPPDGGGIGERILRHCREHPVGREMLADARPIDGDQRAFSNLPYRVRKIAGDGWICVGDAAGFLDPLYSPGLDFCSFTSAGAAAMIARERAGESVDADCYNRRFEFCFRSWLDCIYRDKYFYLGDAEIMAAAFLMDIAAYHLGPVAQVYRNPSTMFEMFPFDGKAGRIAAKLIAFYNRRLSVLARKKIAAGLYGRRNAGWRLLVGGFTAEPKVSGRLLFAGISRWLKMELSAIWWRAIPAEKPAGESPATSLR